MLMILARLACSESFWAAVKVAPRTPARKYVTSYRREGEEAEMSASPVIPSPATAGTGAASHGRVSDLLRGHELAGRSPMAR